MKTNNIIAAIFIALTGTAFVACDETDGISVVPVLDKITLEPNLPAPGDSITATAHQAVKGKLINATTYNWQFTYWTQADDGSTVKVDTLLSQHTNYDGEYNGDPYMGYRLPTTIVPGSSIMITINASYSCSGQTAQGALYGSANKTQSFSIK
ncbi:MAG: hypothetical protein J5486_01340 [Bacteroidaceae bacterium]|nr:hypothetical protein [Bacteroidaceae bacterium]